MEQVFKIGDKVKTVISDDISTGIIIDEGSNDEGEETYEIEFDNNKTYTLPRHFLVLCDDKYNKDDGSFNHDLFFIH